MKRLRRFVKRLTSWAKIARDEDRLRAEIESHIALQTEDNLRAGMSPDEARRQAVLKFGAVESIKEEYRDQRGLPFIEDLLRDVQYALRQLRRNPGFTIVAVLTLALGIGANTAIYSFIDALILRTLPVRHPQVLVLFGPGDQSGNSDNFPDSEMHLFSYPVYREIQQKNRVFSGVAAFSSSEAGLHGTVGASGELEAMEVELVSGTYFEVLGVNPYLGRVLTDADDQTLGGHPVAVISYGWWNSRFSRDPAILGRTLTLGRTVYNVIGVTPPGFFGTTVGRSPDFWIPLQMHDLIDRGPHKISDKFYRSLDIIARLKPGATRSQAAANVNLIFKNILHEYAGSEPTAQQLQDIRKAHITLYSAATGNSLLREGFSKPLWMLMAMVGLVLLIACANIANLLLARATARQREIAVRMAMGAGRGRLIRQLLTESALLAGAGGVLGILFAEWACRFLLAMVSRTQHVLALDVSLDAPVLAFTMLVSLGCAVLFGIFPALRSTGVRLTPALTEGRGAMPAHDRSLLGKSLIVSQVALSLVLLVGAGLFVRSLVTLANVNTGFNKQGVLLFRVDPSATGYDDELRLATMYRQIEQRVDALPGVRASSFSIYAFHQGGWDDSAWAEGYRAVPGAQHDASFNAVGPGYFSAMGLPILAGRDFGPQDTAASPRVAVINETMARRLFPGGSPIGKRFGMSGPEHSNDIEVVGVVRDAKYYALDEAPEAFAYYPYTQYSPHWGTGLYLREFEVRYSGNPQDLAPAVRRAMGEVNPSLPIGNVQTLADEVDASITVQRLVAELSAFFGLLAVFLACIGIYGLASYAVSRRTNEIGIRMALGAEKRDVVKMVIGQGLKLTLIGVTIGIAGALGLTRFLSSLLYGVKPTDPLTFIAVSLILIAVTLAACYIPARRAAKVDPMMALRYE
ncbi:MAG TPA: ABC transporter permease [Terriglobia bacterium]|nr:ABC transporter permease [Terriglobia bacterium]